MSNRTKVLVGFSGGVDSTAAVILLKKAGYDVVGLCFNVVNNYFPSELDEIASKLGIGLIKECVARQFRENVIRPFMHEYENGRTPNPCIFCNPSVKFSTLLRAAEENGCEFIATGHYAGIQRIDDTYYVTKARNEKKDQSYMLYRLSQEVLSRLILPLRGVIDKEDIRSLVRAEGLLNAEKKDSQDICFIPDGDYKSYLMSAGATNRLGKFLDTKGNVLGEHQGVLNYTVGQRKGLGITFGRPAYVVEIKDNNVILGFEEDLLQKKVMVNQLFWTGNKPYESERLLCKLRYSAKEAICTVHYIDDALMELDFDEAQRAPAPGQSAVLYRSKLAVGGGFIVK